MLKSTQQLWSINLPFRVKNPDGACDILSTSYIATLQRIVHAVRGSVEIRIVVVGLQVAATRCTVL